jgi:hypothetical protein
MQDTSTKQDKQVTIDVPEDRLPEFYAFYSRFLAVGSAGPRRGRGYGGHRGHAGGAHRCGGHHATEQGSTEQAATEQPGGPATGSAPAGAGAAD